MRTKFQSECLAAPEWWASTSSSFLQNHPWFEVTWLGASDRSAASSIAKPPLGGWTARCRRRCESIIVDECKPGNGAPRLVFSAMDASVATEIERAFAQAGHVVVSNSRNHRMEPDVPLLVPEVNRRPSEIIPLQQRQRGWKGQIATNPNCSTIVLTMALAPLKQFGITQGDRHHACRPSPAPAIRASRRWTSTPT